MTPPAYRLWHHDQCPIRTLSGACTCPPHPPAPGTHIGYAIAQVPYAKAPARLTHASLLERAEADAELEAWRRRGGGGAFAVCEVRAAP
jgi:hypothetical protein